MESSLKTVILGEGRVGKTSLLFRYFHKKFDENQQSTVNSTHFNTQWNYKGKSVEFNFWDTAGQEKYNALNAIYYQNSLGAIIVYDVTNFETFEKVKKWVNEIKEMVGKDVCFVIAGNKFDLITSKSDLEKNQAEIDAYIKQEKVKHFYTSAKSGHNISDVFECLMNWIMEKTETEVPMEMGGGKKKKLKLNQESEKNAKDKKAKDKSCC